MITRQGNCLPLGLGHVILICITSIKLFITQVGVSNEIVKHTTSNDNSLLCNQVEMRDAFQNAPLILQDPKDALDAISQR
jgi:hypothetical protein